MITQPLIDVIRTIYQLDWNGVHGASHWARVRLNGLKLAEITGANVKVVELFSFLHDSCRLNDFGDHDHGTRAALFAEELRGQFFDLTDIELDQLTYACRHHTSGYLDADITVLTCWDADRLDLGRVGIMPDPLRLCTAAAKDSNVIKWAYARSIKALVRPDSPVALLLNI